MTYLVIALGASTGAIGRFLLSRLNVLHQLPYGTLLANLSGSFFLGLFYFMAEKMTISLSVRQFIQVGLLGALTTYSTLNLEMVLLLQKSEIKFFIIYFFLNSCCGILALLAGKFFAELI